MSRLHSIFERTQTSRESRTLIGERGECVDRRLGDDRHHSKLAHRTTGSTITSHELRTTNSVRVTRHRVFSPRRRRTSHWSLTRQNTLRLCKHCRPSLAANFAGFTCLTCATERCPTKICKYTRKSYEREYLHPREMYLLMHNRTLSMCINVYSFHRVLVAPVAHVTHPW